MRGRMQRQPVITGLGIISPIGIGLDNFWLSACAGRSGTTAPSIVDASKLPRDCQIVGEVSNFDPRKWLSLKATRMAGRFSQFALAAASMAYADSGIESSQFPPERIKVSIGTSMSGLI